MTPTKKDGDKPQLTVVVNNNQITQEYNDLLDTKLAGMRQSKISGFLIDPYEELKVLDPKKDNSRIRDWMDSNDVLTKSKFDRLMNKVACNKAISDRLGFVPSDVLDFVRRFTIQNNITLSANDQIIRQRNVRWNGIDLSADQLTDSSDTESADYAYRLGSASTQNLDDLKVELRLIRDQLDLGYRDSSIGDAVRTWSDQARIESKISMFMNIKYQKGKATGPIGQDMWIAMENACFDVRDSRSGFAIEVIRKFMWQVKRKAVGLPITNHLMPVLTGPQGKGKSTFVEAMCAPIADAMKRVDFTTVTNDKIIDIWKSSILFIDEMGGFTKSDADVIKNIITSPTINRRPMGSNSTIDVTQSSTFIGCSNKSLAQLIRDETGGRRFAELLWTMTPDWNALNAIDWTLLWQSVDEKAPCPISVETRDLLVSQQEANRNQHPVEMWAKGAAKFYNNWTSSNDMFKNYREWEKEMFPRYDTTLSMFGRTIGNLINSMEDFPLEKKKDRSGSFYRVVR